MTKPRAHAGRPAITIRAITTRLKRAKGRVRRAVGTIETGRLCFDLATQVHAVVKGKRAAVKIRPRYQL